jgi:hypothetical protein
MSIPKVIHYCWFGKKPKSQLILTCIQTWKEVLSDYEIIEWNESNYRSESFFFNECMSQKKYAFASDYARFDVLSKHGGIYLDTDMLFIKGMDEVLLQQCFFGYEDDRHVSCGIIGAIPRHPFITSVMKVLDAVDSNLFFNSYTIVKVVNDCYNSVRETNKDILPTVYQVDFFYPYPYAAAGEPLSYKTSNTIAVHLWNATWFNDFSRSELLYSQGKKAEGRKLYLKSLITQPKNLRFLGRYLKVLVMAIC